MRTVAIAVDLAKNVFELAIAARPGATPKRRRLSRPQFETFWGGQTPCRVIMEACSSAHYWARHLTTQGFDVVLLPPQYVAPYRRRNKTDRADCEALLEADRCAGIHPVAVESEDQQALLSLHRVRAQWLATRTARINTMRGLLHEFGIIAPRGARRFMNELHQKLAVTDRTLPPYVQRMIESLWSEVRDLEQHITEVEKELTLIARENPTVQSLGRIPGLAY